jgi:succinyl-CoA synthetase beta subunit
MSSGGGASLTAMDALIKNGGKPANYTEYSGNPSKEKVQKLTKVVLSKPDLHGLWIVGAVANFTDVYETLSGIIEGLRETEKELGRKFDFPIVIRRGGPRDKEAFEMLRQVKDFDLHLYGEETSISQSAEIMARLAKEYSQKGALSS